ncbi:unnamed protein product, partial [marine sediment metagenome]
LGTIWEHYECGYFPLSMHIRYVDGKPLYFTQEFREKKRAASKYPVSIQDKILAEYKEMYGEGGLICDSRLKKVKECGGQMIAKTNWFYGYSSFSLESALKVNGMDELMDGDFSLMDVDFGQRLAMAEHENIFLLDIKLLVIEHCHDSLSSRVFGNVQDIGTIKCNYAILELNKRKKRCKANQTLLDAEDLDYIKKETLGPACSWRPHLYMDDCEGPMFKLWAENQPIFDLREERRLE